MTEDKYVVVEMDMALVCEDTKTRGFGVYMIPGSNFSIAQFQLFNDKIGRVHTGSSGGYSVTAPYTAGQFGHLKFVLDRETRKFGYFWNGQLVESSVGTLYTDGALQFAIPLIVN